MLYYKYDYNIQKPCIAYTEYTEYIKIENNFLYVFIIVSHKLDQYYVRP